MSRLTMRRIGIVAAVGLAVLWGAARTPATAGEVTVAVAANFMAAARDIAVRFEAESGHKVRLVSGSSGKIYAQIIHGAPFDVFLSADQQKPRELAELGLVIKDSRFTYAIGRLVLWTPDPDRTLDGPAILKSGEFRRLAIANPRLAPYGLAARELLEKLDLWTTLTFKLVQGENIAQAYQFVASGNAELGLLALSQVHGGRGSAWIVPSQYHSPLRQDAAVLKQAADRDVAMAFVAFLRSDMAWAVLRDFGYEIPEEQE